MVRKIYIRKINISKIIYSVSNKITSISLNKPVQLAVAGPK